MIFVISKPLCCRSKGWQIQRVLKNKISPGLVLVRAPGNNTGVIQDWHQASYLEHEWHECLLSESVLCKRALLSKQTVWSCTPASLLGGHKAQWQTHMRKSHGKAQTLMSQGSGHCSVTLWAVSWIARTYRCISHIFSTWEYDMCLKEVPQPLGYLLCFRSNERVNKPGTHFQGTGIENKLLKVAW